MYPATCLVDSWVKFESRGFYMPFDDESFLSFFFISSPPPSHSALKKSKSSQELCKDLHWKTDTVDDECYDIEVKVAENEKELLVFVMEMNRSLTVCQNFYGSSPHLYFYPG